MINEAGSVVSLKAYKASKDYERYLETLGHSQLEIEMKEILNSKSQDTFIKGKSLLKEITGRADQPVRLKIQRMNEGLYPEG